MASSDTSQMASQSTAGSIIYKTKWPLLISHFVNLSTLYQPPKFENVPSFQQIKAMSWIWKHKCQSLINIVQLIGKHHHILLQDGK